MIIGFGFGGKKVEYEDFVTVFFGGMMACEKAKRTLQCQINCVQLFLIFPEKNRHINQVTVKQQRNFTPLHSLKRLMIWLSADRPEC